MNELAKGIYEFKNILHKDTCDFLISSINPYIQLGEPYISGALGSKNKRKLELYNNDKFYNISLDIFNNVFIQMENIVSYIYKTKHIIKQTYYSNIKSGGMQLLHTDNHYLSKNGQWVEREESGQDKSCILYLNDSYAGGELNFPEQNLKIKPEIGSIIVFEGDHTRPHEVLSVREGERCNMITFLGPYNE
jgi:hypothetical protein